ncbi:MAG TPA: DUF4282 domain-containing protein [Jiangellaceae bacterium]
MGALFDLSFKKFVAPTIARIVYGLAMALVVISYLTSVIVAFSQDAGTGFLVLLILGPLVSLISLAFIRVGLESLLASILTAQNTAELVRIQGGTPPSLSGWAAGGGAGPAGPAPGYPEPGYPSANPGPAAPPPPSAPPAP